jgi:NhaP-type Na+/H+ or K+/H+ antiporter
VAEINVILVVVAACVLMLGFLSNWIKDKLPVSEALLCVLIGVLVGWAGWVDPDTFVEPKRVLESMARLAVAIAVTGAALQLPDRYFRRQRLALFIVLGPGMVLMWLFSGLIVYLLFRLPFWTALLIAASVTPTDPVLAGSIVTGRAARKNLPDRLKHLISAESSANDGLGYPFVFLALLVTQHGLAKGVWIWSMRIMLWGVACAALLGAVIGAVSGMAFAALHKRGYIGREPLLTITVALSLLSVGAVKLVGSDGILAAFVAGLAFRGVARVSEQQEDFHESIKRFFSFPAFILFGMLLPFGQWQRWGGVLVVSCIAILLLRRPPEIMAQRRWLAPLQTRKDGLFVGWFGPIGISSLYYSLLASRRARDDEVWVIVSAIIFSSVIAHGVSATPLTNLYGRTTHLPEKEASGTH